MWERRIHLSVLIYGDAGRGTGCTAAAAEIRLQDERILFSFGIQLLAEPAVATKHKHVASALAGAQEKIVRTLRAETHGYN